MTAQQKRFPASLYSCGTEPDPRFTLANERTMLAWTRTALALIAGGIALETFGVAMEPNYRLAASALLFLAGMALPVHAWCGWYRVERALRQQKPLPAPPRHASDDRHHPGSLHTDRTGRDISMTYRNR